MATGVERRTRPPGEGSYTHQGLTGWDMSHGFELTSLGTWAIYPLTISPVFTPSPTGTGTFGTNSHSGKASFNLAP